MNQVLLMILSMTLVSCSSFFSHRTFIDEMDRDSDGVFVPGEDFSYTPGDSGSPYRTYSEISRRTPASAFSSENQRQADSIYHELEKKEQEMSDRDAALYRRASSYLENPSEKIYFLSLNYDEKIEYLRSMGVEGASYLRDDSVGRGLAALQPVYGKTLNMGMTKDDVLHVWGQPARVEVAGNPKFENERWIFYDNGRIRHVYFEGGSVQGWNVQ